MESTIAGAGFAGERRTLGSNDDYRLKTSQKKQVISQSFDETPSSIYSWSISHILNTNSSVWVVWAAHGSKEKKGDLSFSEQLLKVFFSTTLEVLSALSL